MGIAEVIPGVSGGTIAFISGIYETLINSIKSVDFELIKMLLKGDFKAAFAKINFGLKQNLQSDDSRNPLPSSSQHTLPQKLQYVGEVRNSLKASLMSLSRPVRKKEATSQRIRMLLCCT